jgi:hypothetical protein
VFRLRKPKPILSQGEYRALNLYWWVAVENMARAISCSSFEEFLTLPPGKVTDENVAYLDLAEEFADAIDWLNEQKR